MQWNEEISAQETNAKPENPKMKSAIVWYCLAVLSLCIMSIMGYWGMDPLWKVFMHPDLILRNISMLFTSLLISTIGVLILPLLHFAFFALMPSKRNARTFLRILKGWNITLVSFLVAGLLAGELNRHVREDPFVRQFEESSQSNKYRR